MKISIKILSIILYCFSTGYTLSGTEKEALLIGTFHYHNPGADVVKTRDFDILSHPAQNELQFMAQKISSYDPDRIFVEWPYDRQDELDSLYQLYLAGDYFSGATSNFYLKNEIFQLAFRVAKASKHTRVYAVDYNKTDFPFDSLMVSIKNNKQTVLEKQIEDAIRQFSYEFDNKIESGASVLDLTYYLNSAKMRKLSNQLHCEVPLLAGNPNDFTGPYLASEWFRRNLYIWSLIQKATRPKDQKVVLLLGASHIALIKNFINQNENWKTIELKEIMNK